MAEAVGARQAFFSTRGSSLSVKAAMMAVAGGHPGGLLLGRDSHKSVVAGLIFSGLQPPLDHAAMREAAQSLVGRHDFTSYRASSCQAKSPVRTLDRLDVSRDGDIVSVIAEARSFLHHQVRNMIGTLKLVGEGRWPVSQVAESLLARDRRAAGPTAPPDGLCLTRVCYDTCLFSRNAHPAFKV